MAENSTTTASYRKSARRAASLPAWPVSVRNEGGLMRWGLVLLFAGLLLVFPAAVLAQTTGNIEGSITDTSGGALPVVTVEATSSSLQGIRAAVSGRDAAYRCPGVPPGLARTR